MTTKKGIFVLFFAVFFISACAIPKNGKPGPVITNLKLPNFSKAGVFFPVEFDFRNAAGGVRTFCISMDKGGEGKYFDDCFEPGYFYGIPDGHLKRQYYLRGPGSFFVRVYVVDYQGNKSNILRGLVVVM